MNIALFEDSGWRNLLPLTWTRPVWELRCGRESLAHSIERFGGAPIARVHTRLEIAGIVEVQAQTPAAAPASDWLLVNGRAIAFEALPPLPVGSAWWTPAGELVAARLTSQQAVNFTATTALDDAALRAWSGGFASVPCPKGVRLVQYPWQLALWNADALRSMRIELDAHRGTIYPGAHLVEPHQIEIGTGSRIKPGVVLDAEEGPIVIGENVLIQPNAVVEGPCFIDRNTIIRPGAAIRANTSIGPMCRIGGEVEGSIIHGYSNKQHDGFLGHSYVGRWVNLGADTVTSDLKNTYGTIRVALNGVEMETGERFIGSIIGDHAKTGIGTILPTGCILGVAANVFTQGRVPKFVPSFSWLTDDGVVEFRVDKAIEIARTVMGRRKIVLSPDEETVLRGIFLAARNASS